jgi:hypothetical protein
MYSSVNAQDGDVDLAAVFRRLSRITKYVGDIDYYIGPIGPRGRPKKVGSSAVLDDLEAARIPGVNDVYVDACKDIVNYHYAVSPEACQHLIEIEFVSARKAIFDPEYRHYYPSASIAYRTMLEKAGVRRA